MNNWIFLVNLQLRDLYGRHSVLSDLMELKTLLTGIYPIGDEAIAEMQRHISVRRLTAGELLIRQGQPTEYVYLVREGAFRNYCTSDGRESTRWFAIEGDIFTSMFSFSKGEPAMSSVVALIDSYVYCAPIGVVKRMIEENKEWAVWTAQYCLDGLYQLERRYTFLGSGDAYTRYKNLMKYKTFQLLNNVPLQVIATYLNVAPQTISRIRRRIAHEK